MAKQPKPPKPPKPLDPAVQLLQAALHDPLNKDGIEALAAHLTALPTAKPYFAPLRRIMDEAATMPRPFHMALLSPHLVDQYIPSGDTLYSATQLCARVMDSIFR